MRTPRERGYFDNCSETPLLNLKRVAIAMVEHRMICSSWQRYSSYSRGVEYILTIKHRVEPPLEQRQLMRKSLFSEWSLGEFGRDSITRPEMKPKAEMV
mmetsp:Transcript_15797/g.23118  ORF Transcript_15797/g.23118 Transcript_15797/m.23118 type:complete len:99 (-) Transcript_15797:263-559(-)